MEASLDTADLRTGLPARTYPAPAVTEGHGRWANALVPALPPIAVPPEDGRRRYLIPAILLAGWGGLFAYCATYLREDLPFRPQSGTELGRRAEDASRPVVVLPEVPDEPTRVAADTAPREAERPTRVAAVAPTVSTPIPAQPATVAPRPAASPAAEYVGTWGPTPAACGSPSRRRGYLPATITTDRRGRAGPPAASTTGAEPETAG